MSAARTHRIGLMPGDGIGPEVTAEAFRVLEAVGEAEGFGFETVGYDLGADRYLRTGEILPQSVLDELPALEAVLMGAVGDPRVAPGVLEGGLLLALRQQLDLYINLRPSKLFDGVASALAGVTPEDLDITIVRENTEGLYARQGSAAGPGQPATEISVNTDRAIRRCVRYAFDLAASAGRSLTLVHKINVLERAGGLWKSIFDEVAAEYPSVTTGYQHVDACGYLMVQQPQRFQVIVTDNLFGDILSDLAAGLVGGLGLVGSGNINAGPGGPGGPGELSIFEPVHGSAPDIAGTGKANPIAAVISGGLLLRHIGEAAGAARVEAAVAAVAGKAAGRSTTEIGDALVEACV